MPLEGRGLAIFVISAIFMFITIVTVSLRCFVRSFIVRAFGWDDILMLVALVNKTIPQNNMSWNRSNGHPGTVHCTSSMLYDRNSEWSWSYEHTIP